MDSDQAKLFIGGISHDATEATLRDHFSQYGVVSASKIAKDHLTGAPRGFAFLSFSHPSSADKALEDSSHVILGKKVTVMRAKSRNQRPMMSPQQFRSGNVEASDDGFRTRKIFVGGLSASVTNFELGSYFARFGRVTDVVVMVDNMTRRSRGFGFVTFESEVIVENVMRSSFHQVCGKVVEVKRAVPRPRVYESCDWGYQRGGNRGGYIGSAVPHTNGVLPTPAVYTGFRGFSDGTGVYGNWSPVGGYTGIPYGVPPMVPQVWMYPYGDGFYPAYNPYMGGGGWVAAAGGHNLYNRAYKPAMYQCGFVSEQVPADVKSSGVEGEELDVDGNAA